MRTKTLLLSAVALAAGLVSSQAQNVYSANVVGYVNATVPANGFALIQNPMNFIDATGATNNAMSNVLVNLPITTTKAYIYDPNSSTFATYTLRASGWGLGAGVVLNPGTGFFVQNTATTNINIVFPGQVIQGTNTAPLTFIAGYNLIGGVDPLSGPVETGLGLPVVNNDKVYQFNPSTGTYGTFTRRAAAWGGGLEPVIGTNSTYGVAEAFWYQAVSAGTWTNKFTVQ